MKTKLSVLIAIITLGLLMNISFAQLKILSAEYFIDADPGVGNGTPLLPEDGNFNSLFEKFSSNISTSSLSEGIHTLYVRLKNSDDTWGKTFAKTFIVRN